MSPMSRSFTRHPNSWICSINSLRRSPLVSRRVRCSRKAPRFRSTPPSIITRCIAERSSVSACWYSSFKSIASRMARSTCGSSLSACCSVKCRVICCTPCSNPRDLDRERPAAGAVEFREDDALPSAQEHRRVPNLKAESLAHEHAAHMRIGVAALAIRVLRVVVAIVVAAVDDALEEALDIVEKRLLPFVQEQRGRGVQGLQVHETVANAALADDVVDAIGDVEQLQALIGDPVDDAAKDPISGNGQCLQRCGRLVFDGV